MRLRQPSVSQLVTVSPGHMTTSSALFGWTLTGRNIYAVCGDVGLKVRVRPDPVSNERERGQTVTAGEE